MVWFYRMVGRPRSKGHVCFQSHYGLILSVSSRLLSAYRQSFNPTMVWFYLIILPHAWISFLIALSIPLWSDFIAKQSRAETAEWKSTFNPTMVWFYRYSACGREQAKDHHLSIPLWSDFICLVNKNRNFTSHHLWLSIPLWSDFI